jgi:hypothetical protein
MLHGGNLFAITAGPAGDSSRNGFCAVQSLGEAQSQSPPTQPGRSAKKIGVAHISACRVLVEHIHSPFMSEHIPVISHKVEGYKSKVEGQRFQS